MIVCESEFARPDPKNPDYAAHEVDVYGHLPYRKRIQVQHRLSVRKNLKKNTFEAYKHYSDRLCQDEVVSTGTLASVIDFTNVEVFEHWNIRNQDQVCDHNKVLSRHCQAIKWGNK